MEVVAAEVEAVAAVEAVEVVEVVEVEPDYRQR